MKKTIARISIVLVIGLVLFVATNWSLVKQLATFSPIILPNFRSVPADDADARLQDIEYLASLLKYDRSFDATASNQFEQLMAASRQESETMSLAQLYLLVAKASALADNGHTSVSLAPVQRDFNSIGVRYYHFLDGLYVVRTLAEHQQLIGGRVIEIDGQSIDSVLTALKSYFGGAEEWRQLKAIMLLESPEILHAAGLAESPSGYTLTVQNKQGATQQVKLSAQMPQAMEDTPVRKPWMTLEATELPDESDEWMRSLQYESDDLLPLYLQKTDQMYLWVPLQNGGGYLRLQAMSNSKEQSMSAFFEETIEPLPEGSLRYLVVDLRTNAGGDFSLFVEVAKWLPSKVAADGHVYIVVGPQTFSAGVVGAALLKYYGGEKSSIIGSPMGDREQFWAERGMTFRLPNAGFVVSYATGYHDWANGCVEHPYCFTQVLIHGVKAGSLTPVHTVEPEYSDYAVGWDVVMEWVYQQELP